MPILYNPYKKKGVFMIPAGGLGPSVSADFSYSKSSYHQGEADPTPTITGTTGGSFVCTSGAVFVDTGSTSSSTGQIDLDASTIDTHLISYTVDGVTATANVGITPSPYLDNTFSMQFDGVGDYITAGTTLGDSLGSSYTGSITFSAWIKPDLTNGNDGIFSISNLSNSYGAISIMIAANTLYVYTNAGSTLAASISSISSWVNNWKHLTIVWDVSNSSNSKIYVDGVDTTTGGSWSTGTANFSGLTTAIGTYYNTTLNWDGKIDEVAIWNTALSSDAVQEIYDATNNNTGKALDLSTDSGNYTNSSSLQYWNRLGD